MSESIVRSIDGWKLVATQRPDNSWLVEATDFTWARGDEQIGADLEQALVTLAPRLQLDAYELKRAFGINN